MGSSLPLSRKGGEAGCLSTDRAGALCRNQTGSIRPSPINPSDSDRLVGHYRLSSLQACATQAEAERLAHCVSDWQAHPMVQPKIKAPHPLHGWRGGPSLWCSCFTPGTSLPSITGRGEPPGQDKITWEAGSSAEMGRLPQDFREATKWLRLRLGGRRVFP